MTDLTLWTWIAVGVLIAVPPFVFALFLRDARRVLQELTRGDRTAGADRLPDREAA